MKASGFGRGHEDPWRWLDLEDSWTWPRRPTALALALKASGLGLEDTGLGLDLEDPWPWPQTCCPRTHPSSECNVKSTEYNCETGELQLKILRF